MKTWAWVTCGFLALMLAWRVRRAWRRGRPVVLVGKVNPLIVRMVAGILVTWGMGAPAAGQESPAVRVQQDDPLPEGLSEEGLTRWASSWRRAESMKELLRTWVTGEGAADAATIRGLLEQNLPPSFATALLEQWNAERGGPAAAPISGQKLLALLDDLEAHGVIHPWFVGWLWRETGRLPEGGADPELPQLLRRIELHVRMADALTLALADLRPISIPARAWASKARPSREYRSSEAAVVRHVMGALPTAWAKTRDATVFHTDGATPMTVRSGKVRLWRHGAWTERTAGEGFAFRRIDLVEAEEGTVLSHPWLSDIPLPKGRPIGVRDLPGLLPAEARAVVKETIARALGGDDGAQLLLQTSLPLTADKIAEAVNASPDAPGTGALRMMLVLFTEDTSRGGVPTIPIVAQPPPPR